MNKTVYIKKVYIVESPKGIMLCKIVQNYLTQSVFPHETYSMGSEGKTGWEGQWQ